MYFRLQKFTSQNLVNQAAVLCVRNALKVTYEHLRFEKFFRGLYPRNPVKQGGRTRGGKGREGRGSGQRREREREKGRRERNGAPSFQSGAHTASLGLATALVETEPRLKNSRD
jgi:hypothetical protein